MAMALNRKYAALPDLDSAPDIYETPELTDDVSTVPTTTVQSQSDHDFDDEDDSPGISRSRLRVNEARSRFEPANIDARGVDFSDRLNGKRKSYKVSSRRRKVLDDGTEELGDLSDEDDQDLDRKVARLKRELAEVRDEISRRTQIEETPNDGDLKKLDELTTLSSALDDMTLPAKRQTKPRKPASTPQPKQDQEDDGTEKAESGSDEEGEKATYTITYAPTYQQRHALMKAADFDQRLLELEKAIGIGSSALPELETDGLPRAIIPILDTLRKQIDTLDQASVSSLDSIARRARTLTQEADSLTKARQSAKQAKENLDESQVPRDDPASEASEQVTKINALFGTLPTIENLTPLLPPLLDRLRSLRAIHSEAAAASQALDKLEKNQAEMAEDIKLWREGLEQVEAAVEDSEETMQTNQDVIEGWVKKLEESMARLQ